jgi:hypothetical protein
MTGVARSSAKTANQCRIATYRAVLRRAYGGLRFCASRRYARRAQGVIHRRRRRQANKEAPVKLLILLLAVVLAGYLLAAVWNPERF